MKPNEFNGLELPDENDDEAAREFGRQIAMDGILREFFPAATTEEPSTSDLKIHGDTKPTQPSTKQPSGKRTRTLWLTVAALAASVLGFVALRGVLNTEVDKPGQLASEGVVIREDLTFVGWEIKAHPEAEAERVDANTLRLIRGELTLVAKEENPPSLKVITPNSEFYSTGSQCLIGFHNLTQTVTGEPPMFKQMTRVFLLAGLATLSNQLGAIEVHAEELARVIDNDAPVAVTVDYNTQFAAELYQQLSGDNDENIFISPLSVSNSLAMLLEGARGKTAAELAEVLHLPNATRRTGDDAQNIPWETVKIYSGISKLNEILGRNTDEDIMRQQQKVDALGKALDAHREKFLEAMESATAKEDNRKRLNELAIEELDLVRDYNNALRLLGGYQLKVANTMWLEQTLPVNQNYVETINKAFNTGGVQMANFKTGDERNRLNAWVAENTNHKIKGFFQPGMLSSDTRLVLGNAIYFQGDWQFPFETSNTKQLPFTKSDGSKIKTQMMSERFFDYGLYGAIEDDGSVFKAPKSYNKNATPKLYPGDKGFHMLSLPYRGDEVSMVWLAPMSHDGLPNIESKLSNETLTKWLGALENRKTHVKVPKFRLEETYDLKGVLRQLGLETLFESFDGNNGANLTGIVNGPSKDLFVSGVFQKTFVEVNEKGTEAAAATMAIVDENSTMTPEELVPFIPEFTADRPFLFVIRHNETGAILFMGRITNPAG